MSDNEFEHIWLNIPKHIRKYVWKSEFRKIVESENSQLHTLGKVEVCQISKISPRNFSNI